MTAVWEIAAIAIALGVAVIVISQRRAAKRLTILFEDALKHLYDYEYNSIDATLDSLAGVLGETRDRSAKVIEALVEKKFVILEGSEIFLTDRGREYALKIIRRHRLWERYLSDETMVEEVEWHKQAELKEHTLSQEEVGQLSKRLGYPVYDPHGDPIPSPEGSIPAQQGRPLQSFLKGETVNIIHVEDEPASVYAELVALKIYPGMSVKVIGHGEGSIVIQKEGSELTLPLVIAANIRALPARKKIPTEKQKTLASLDLGETGIVSGISATCRGLQRRRLMDLGIVPGTAVGAELRSPGGDPTAYRIRGATIALRRQQAEMVFLEEGQST